MSLFGARRALTTVTAMLLASIVAACSPDSPGDPGGTDPAAGTSATVRGDVLENDFLLGGIQVHEATLEGWLDALERAGMNTVSVTDYAHQGDWDSANLWWEPNPHLLPEIRAAKERGMRVVLILRLALDRSFPRNRFLWHGMIMPELDYKLREWFARYQGFVRHWAEIAEREGIDVLMIGSELNALTSTVPLAELPALEEYFLNEEKQEERRGRMRGQGTELGADDLWLNSDGADAFADVGEYLEARIEAERAWAESVTFGGPVGAVERMNERRALLEELWLETIACARGVFRGPLGYAANFDQYQEVSFWDRLDVIGINAYFKLRDHLVPAGDREELARVLGRGWRGVLGEIDAFQGLYGLGEKPVIFTEMGFTNRANSTIETWADRGFAHVRKSVRATPDETELVVWNRQPIDPGERALAVAALDDARRALGFPLRGILYWKLSSHDYHRDDEPFLLLIGQDQEDPLLPALRRLARE